MCECFDDWMMTTVVAEKKQIHAYSNQPNSVEKWWWINVTKLGVRIFKNTIEKEKNYRYFRRIEINSPANEKRHTNRVQPNKKIKLCISKSIYYIKRNYLKQFLQLKWKKTWTKKNKNTKILWIYPEIRVKNIEKKIV